MNSAFTGKGNDSEMAAMKEVIEAGAAGLKLHEDSGSTPAAISKCLDVADMYDVQVGALCCRIDRELYTSLLCLKISGRTIHTYHTEGAGGCILQLHGRHF